MTELASSEMVDLIRSAHRTPYERHSFLARCMDGPVSCAFGRVSAKPSMFELGAASPALDKQSMPRVAAPMATVRADVVEMCPTMALCH